MQRRRRFRWSPQLELIQELQGDPWWHDVNVPMLEVVRRRLRGLVALIDKAQRKVVYTDFEDSLGSETVIDLPNVSGGDSFERFRIKARQLLNEHKEHLASRS